MHIDIYDLTWMSLKNQRLVRVINMELQEIKDDEGNVDELVLMWYKDMGTDEVHCMTENIFLLNHKACGQHEMAYG